MGSLGAHRQLQWHDCEPHTGVDLGLQQGARPALWRLEAIIPDASKEILRLRNINCTGPEQVCLENFPWRFSERSPDQQVWHQVGVCVVAGPRLGALNEALEGGPAI